MGRKAAEKKPRPGGQQLALSDRSVDQIAQSASRILGAAARRLPDDWQEQYARRPVLLETFVGLDKFKGTCYLAANWIRIGATEGYSLHPEYRKRAEAKGIFVYPLEKNFRQILCETD